MVAVRNKTENNLSKEKVGKIKSPGMKEKRVKRKYVDKERRAEINKAWYSGEKCEFRRLEHAITRLKRTLSGIHRRFENR